MDPDMMNCMLLRTHVEKKTIIIIPSHAIYRQTSVSARFGRKKKKKPRVLVVTQALVNGQQGQTVHDGNGKYFLLLLLLHSQSMLLIPLLFPRWCSDDLFFLPPLATARIRTHVCRIAPNQRNRLSYRAVAFHGNLIVQQTLHSIAFLNVSLMN